MAKKLITAMLTLTLVACSTISIYATDSSEGEEATVNTNEQIIIEENTEENIEDQTEAPDREKAEKTQKKEIKKTEAAEKEEKLQKGLAAYIRKINPNVSKSKSKSMAGFFMKKGEKYNLDPKVLMAIAQGESTFYTSAKSPYGYKGLMQTSDALARKYGYKPSSLYKAEVSIEVGARYLRQMKKMFKTYTKAISAYAYGEGSVKSGNYSTSHAKKVLKRRDEIQKFLERNNYI